VRSEFDPRKDNEFYRYSTRSYYIWGLVQSSEYVGTVEKRFDHSGNESGEIQKVSNKTILNTTQCKIKEHAF